MPYGLSFGRIALWVCIGITVLLFGPSFWLWVTGFPVWQPGWYVAQELVKEAKSPEQCLRIIVPLWNIFGPPASEQRTACIYEYASITKDPSVCELLMPSEYGLDCVGAAEINKPCVIEKNYSISGNGISVSLRECINGPSNIRNNACCVVGLAAFINDRNDCTKLLKKGIFFDQCNYELAWKTRDESWCEGITNSNMRIACEVRTKALGKNPSICSSCSPRLDSVDQLPK